MNIDFTDIIVALIGLLATVITTYLVPFIKSKLTAQQQSTLEAIARTGVYAAEQLFNVPKSGSEKLEYVTNYATQLLTKLGIRVDADRLRAAIEAAVKELHIEGG
jgi:LL-H family phage holin